MRRHTVCLPVNSSSFCWRVMGVLLLSSFMALVKLPSLTVWSYAAWRQAEGLLHRTSIVLSLALGLSQSDRLFPSVQKTKTKQNKPTKKKKKTHQKQTNKTKNKPTKQTNNKKPQTNKQKNSHGYQCKNKISPARFGSCGGLEHVDQYPRAEPDGNRGREAENADEDPAARGVK